MTLYGLTDEQEKELREEVARLRNLTSIAQRHKRVLEEQVAKFGSLHVPSHIILQISDLDDNIKEYQAKIESYKMNTLENLRKKVKIVEGDIERSIMITEHLIEARKHLAEAQIADVRLLFKLNEPSNIIEIINISIKDQESSKGNTESTRDRLNKTIELTKLI